MILGPQPGRAAPERAGLRFCSNKAPSRSAEGDSPSSQNSLRNLRPFEEPESHEFQRIQIVVRALYAYSYPTVREN